MPEKQVIACNMCRYTSNRGYNMSRHLHNQHGIPLTDDILDHNCTYYSNEHEMLVMNSKPVERLDMELDLEPYYKGDVYSIVEDPIAMRRLSELEYLMTSHKYEKLIAEFYKGQMYYDDGVLHYQDKEVQLKDSEVYNLWHSLTFAYCMWLMLSMNNCMDRAAAMEITNTTSRIASSKTTRGTIINKVRDYIAHGFRKE